MQGETKLLTDHSCGWRADQFKFNCYLCHPTVSAYSLNLHIVKIQFVLTYFTMSNLISMVISTVYLLSIVAIWWHYKIVSSRHCFSVVLFYESLRSELKNLDWLIPPVPFTVAAPAMYKSQAISTCENLRARSPSASKCSFSRLVLALGRFTQGWWRHEVSKV